MLVLFHFSPFFCICGQHLNGFAEGLALLRLHFVTFIFADLSYLFVVWKIFTIFHFKISVSALFFTLRFADYSQKRWSTAPVFFFLKS